MRSYAQSGEDLIVQQIFGSYKGTLLSVGENDGSTYSNSRLLIENGFSAHLLEPGEACADLMCLHKDNDKVSVHNIGIGEKTGEVTFYESDNHVPGGTDKGLVSSTSYAETERWRKAGVNFRETTIQLLTFKDFYESIGKPRFDYITIDAESQDWIILQQIGLDAVGCKVLVIEFNSDPELMLKMIQYCRQFRLEVVHRNNENLIFKKL